MSIPAESPPQAQPAARVIVGLSGGVDSSVAALLLLEQGYRVEGLFMKSWDEPGPDGACRWEADVEDALQVCERLGIPLNTVDLSAEYRERVFSRFLADYGAGRTPNPDVLCNQEIKFSVFLDQALVQGADLIATGHYARRDRAGGFWRLLKARDAAKDQSYFLCRLDQAQLARALFPLGDLMKPEVRALARRAGFVTHDKKDSTGICFIEPRAFREFLSRYLPEKPGPIVTVDGTVIGEHRGAHFYTIGQRQGLRVGGVRGAKGAPWYVVDKDVASNTVTVAQGPDHALLYCRRIRAVAPHWIGPVPKTPFSCTARTRYRQPDQPCTIESLNNDTMMVGFATPQRAVAPGQYLVLYDGDVCLGGAVIDQPLR